MRSHLSQIEKLPLNSRLSVTDTLASLSEVTGFDDQVLLNKMPLLKEHQSTVTLSDISGANISRIQVSLEGSNATYMINFSHDSEPTIISLDHDDIPVVNFK